MVMPGSQKAVTEARFTGCWTTYLGAVDGVLKAAGMSDMDMAFLAGMTGMAFHLIVHEGCCPSSVTVYDWMGEHLQALDRIGVLSEAYLAFPDAHTYEAACQRAVSSIKAAIDRGVGVVIWGIDVPEFGVIYGYDDGDGVFLVDGAGKWWLPSGSDPILYDNVGRSCEVPILHYQIPVKQVPFDRSATYRRSLEYYISQMEKEYHDSPAYKSGFLAYDNWLNALAGGNYNPAGLRYITAVYAEAKELAAAYVQGLANTWEGLPGLEEIAAKFAAVAEVYKGMMSALNQDWAEGAALLSRAVSREQAAKLTSLVKEARALEVQAIDLVKHSLSEKRV